MAALQLETEVVILVSCQELLLGCLDSKPFSKISFRFRGEWLFLVIQIVKEQGS